ncbi:IS5 family transposase [Rivihabitans pingtungensis]|uniref:IS5 family transposase n=1 Tax=Rivihabitans pingtungensis TaxID=1054498 RepID=UPI0035714D67
MSKRYALSDAQWERIKDLLPGQAGQPGATAKNNRLFVDAVLYRYRAGIPWRDLPARFGDFRVVHTRHSRWSRTGVWQRVFEALAQDADNEYAMIDSTIVRAHQHSAGAKRGDPDKQALGRSRGGLSTKIHATVDALGNPTGFLLTPGQAHDLQGADALLKDSPAQAVIADKAYDAHARLIKPLLDKGKTVVIPSRVTNRQPREHDRDLYKARHLIENFFARLKQYRAIATRYDKTACNFLGAVYLAAAMVWLA